jgi:hypothetical protein
MRVAAFTISLLICAVGLSSSLGAETRTYAITSQGKTKTQTSVYRVKVEGGLVRVVEEASDPSEGGTVESLLAADGTVSSAEIQMKQGSIRMTSDGKTVESSGTWNGKAISGRYALDGLGFYGNGFSFALRALAEGGLASLKFPMISIAKPSSATVMELKREGEDSFKGKRAIKVKLSLAGAMSVFWSARLLIGEDGTIYRFEGNQGPGTPAMVTELVGIEG